MNINIKTLQDCFEYIDMNVEDLDDKYALFWIETETNEKRKLKKLRKAKINKIEKK